MQRAGEAVIVQIDTPRASAHNPAMLRGSIVLIPLLFCVACGGANQQHKKQIDTLSQQVSDLSEAYESQRGRLDRLREEIALLTDRLETRQIHGVAARRAPARAPVYTQPQVYTQPYVAPAPAPAAALPVVKLRPEAPKTALAPKTRAAKTAPVTRPVKPAAPVAKAEPIKSAPVDTRPPITITQADLDALSGAPMAPVRRRPGQPVPPPANAAMAGNLGVVPLARSRTPRSARRAPLIPVGADPAVTAYRRAHGLYRSGAFSQAAPALVAFVRDHGSHDYADNALFWVGQIQFDQSRFQAALGTFRQVVDTYPAGNKVPDALLMIGLTQAKLGRGAEGRETLARLRAMFPQTEAARKADARLNDKAGSM